MKNSLDENSGMMSSVVMVMLYRPARPKAYSEERKTKKKIVNKLLYNRTSIASGSLITRIGSVKLAAPMLTKVRI
jgi:hypothetical protein